MFGADLSWKDKHDSETVGQRRERKNREREGSIMSGTSMGTRRSRGNSVAYGLKNSQQRGRPSARTQDGALFPNGWGPQGYNHDLTEMYTNASTMSYSPTPPTPEPWKGDPAVTIAELATSRTPRTSRGIPDTPIFSIAVFGAKS
jgi:hypothetical protein